MTRQEIVDVARTWLGTPYQHQGRLKGVAVDCIGLVIGTAHEVGFAEDFDIVHYSRRPESSLLEQYMGKYLQLVSVDDMLPGDVLLLRFGRLPQHAAIVTDKGMIHSYSGAGKVVEHGINDCWRQRIVAVYRFPEVQNG